MEFSFAAEMKGPGDEVRTPARKPLGQRDAIRWAWTTWVVTRILNPRAGGCGDLVLL